MSTDWSTVDWSGLGVATHQHLSAVESTNTWAIQATSKMADYEFPYLITCERQTAGRGRGRRSWWQGEGGLAFSVVLDLGKTLPPNPNRPNAPNPPGGICLPLLAAVSLQQTAAQFLPNELCKIKWPNDLMVNDRKNAGILIEAVSGHPQRFVIGVGVNVNNVKESQAEAGDFDAFCWSETGQTFPLEQVLAAFLLRFLRRCALAAGETVAVQALFHEADWLRGKRIVVTSPAAWQVDSQDNLRVIPRITLAEGPHRFVGTYQGISEQGYLRLSDDHLGLLLFPSVDQIRPVTE